MFFLERVISNDAEIDRLREEIASLVGQNLQRQQGQGLSKQTKRHIAKGIAGLVQDDCMRIGTLAKCNATVLNQALQLMSEENNEILAEDEKAINEWIENLKTRST